MGIAGSTHAPGPMPHALFEEPLRKLLKPLVPGARGFVSNRSDVSSKVRVPPVIPGRLLRIACHAFAGSLQERPRRCGIEAWIVARRQVKLAPRSTGIVSIIIDESA